MRDYLKKRLLIAIFLLAILFLFSCQGIKSEVKPDAGLVIALPDKDYVIIKKAVLTDLLDRLGECVGERNECLDKLRGK